MTKETENRLWLAVGAVSMTVLLTIIAWVGGFESLQSFLWGFWPLVLGTCGAILWNSRSRK